MRCFPHCSVSIVKSIGIRNWRACWELYVTGRAANVKGTVFEVGSLVCVLIFAVFSQGLIPRLSQSGGMFFFAAAIFVFAREAGKISKALSWPPLVRLGETSFSTYMLHDLILRIAVTHGLVQRIGKPWSVLLIVPLVYVLSYVMWAGVEVRFRKILMGMRNSRVATQLVPGQ